MSLPFMPCDSVAGIETGTRNSLIIQRTTNMPKIQSVSVCVARVALDNVTSFATRTVSGRDYCLVKVRSTDGLEGIIK